MEQKSIVSCTGKIKGGKNCDYPQKLPPVFGLHYKKLHTPHDTIKAQGKYQIYDFIISENMSITVPMSAYISPLTRYRIQIAIIMNCFIFSLK